jgi:hypothetical protein
MVFVFPDDDTLRFALTGGLVPPAVSLAAARAGRDANGRPWVQPSGPLPKALPNALRRVGVDKTDGAPPDGRDLAHWLQAVPLRRDPVPPALTDRTPVLFELPDPAGLATVVGEMLRLGNDRQGFRILGTASGGRSALLRVIGPPYYTLLRALDRLGPDAPRAYLERAPHVWAEVGWTHPLVDLLHAPNGQMVLLRPPQEWVYLDEAPFRDVYEVLEFAVPREPTAWIEVAPTDKLVVPLRLAPGGGTESAELWVLAGDGVDRLDALVSNADDRLVARLAFAVGEVDGRPVAVLRARPGKGGPPVLAIDALAYRPYARLPNLFLPVGQRLRPPLRRDAVRQLLADSPDTVTWLVPQDGDSFVPQSMPDAAFRPLADWVEYVLDRDADALTAWVGSARFDFGLFVSKEQPVAAPKVAPRERQTRPARAAAAAAQEAPPPVAPAATKANSKTPAAPPLEPFTAQPAAKPSELQQRLKDMEQRFLAVDGPLDAPERQSLWPELARLNAALHHTPDAALCWASALWEADDPPAAWSWDWAQCERALLQPTLSPADLDRLLNHANPTLPDVRPLAAVLVWAARQRPAPAALRERLPAVQQYLERHDHLLPVRILWLAWHGLAHLSGSDVLMLTRVRDRVLERLLAEGLGAERDLPSFLRYTGQRAGDRLRAARERMERVRHMAHEWFAQPEVYKGKFDQTPAYIDLLFAFGLARLGEATACRQLLQQAAALAESDHEAHRFLLQAFQYRVEQVLAGRPHAGPLPPEQREYLEQLHAELDPLPNEDPHKYGPYAIERLRQDSRVLEPQDVIDVYLTAKRFQDELVTELARLPDVRNRRELGERVRALVQKAQRSRRLAETRLQVLAGVLPLAATHVSEALAEEILLQVGPALDSVPPTERGPILREQQAILLERALFFAAHFDRPELVQTFVDRLQELLAVNPDESALGAVASLVGQSLRSLRKLGLRDAMARVLEQVAQAVLRGHSVEEAKVREGRNWHLALRVLLNVAAGWLYFDDMERARPVLDEARAYLLRKDKGGTGERLLVDKYVALVCTYVTALAHAPLNEAVGRIGELFGSGRMDPIQNSYTSKQYYSRLHLSVVEAVVLALANEGFAVGPLARRWLDDDEYLVRRRIHRDVRAALAAAGL